MAIVQTEAQLRVMAAKVGVHPERASQIKAATPAPANVAALRAIVNRFGYYSEKADHLVKAGVTFA